MLCSASHLFGRKEPSDRVVHEVKLQVGVCLTISKRVELHDTLDASIEDTAASLHVDILR